MQPEAPYQNYCNIFFLFYIPIQVSHHHTLTLFGHDTLTLAEIPTVLQHTRSGRLASHDGCGHQRLTNHSKDPTRPLPKEENYAGWGG